MMSTGGSSSRQTTTSACNESDESDSSNECPICLAPLSLGVRLPCGHKFCFLCIKGERSGRCAICRRKISPDFLERVELDRSSSLVLLNEACSSTREDHTEEAVVATSSSDVNASSDSDYTWFYAGRNGGWWAFEQRCAAEIERAFKSSSANRTRDASSGEAECRVIELLIAGEIYEIDLLEMEQRCKRAPLRRRRIKRDLLTDAIRSRSCKGVAGVTLARRGRDGEEGSETESVPRRETETREQACDATATALRALSLSRDDQA